MNKIMIKLQEFIKWFVFITTGILIVCAVCFSLSPEGKVIPGITLWEILLSGLLTSAITTFFLSREALDKWNVIVVFILHYIFLDMAMFACGVWFGWMSLDFTGVFSMSLSVAGVYLFTFAVNYFLDVQQADAINRKLKEKYKE